MKTMKNTTANLTRNLGSLLRHLRESIRLAYDIGDQLESLSESEIEALSRWLEMDNLTDDVNAVRFQCEMLFSVIECQCPVHIGKDAALEVAIA